MLQGHPGPASLRGQPSCYGVEEQKNPSRKQTYTFSISEPAQEEKINYVLPKAQPRTRTANL